MLSEFAEQHNDTGCRKRDDERYSTVAIARFVSTSFHGLTYGTPSIPLMPQSLPRPTHSRSTTMPSNQFVTMRKTQDWIYAVLKS